MKAARILLELVVVTLAMPPIALAEDQPPPVAEQVLPQPNDAGLKEMLRRTKAVSPVDSLKTLKVEEGFRVELAAAEPDIASPIDMAFDENGRLFVCELWNYPSPLDAKGATPMGRVRLLGAPRGDGTFGNSTIYADDIPNPAGLACWQGGVFVIASPDLLYLKDTHGDGKADVRKKVYSGFKGAAFQIPNTLRWGLDNKIYGACARAGGRLTPADKPDNALEIGPDSDFRFDPRTGTVEAVSGSGEFGNCFDDWGHRFICDSTTLILCPFFPREYTLRSPFVPVAKVTEKPFPSPGILYSIAEPEAWRDVLQKEWRHWSNPTDNPHDPGSEVAVSRFVSAASGVTVYRGGAFPEAYLGNVFTADSASGVVVRTVLRPAGVGFSASRDEKSKREFLASKDPWFKPVNLANGPDGCLYVAACYGETLDSFDGVPDDVIQHLDRNNGRKTGRIYRIAPEKFTAADTPGLGGANIQALVAALDRPDSWARESAQRLLYERQDKSAAVPLRQMARDGKSAQARVHALWTLHGLGAADESTLHFVLNDANAFVRENAIKIAERQLNSSDVLRRKIEGLAEDADVRVRFQAALSLSYSENAEVVDSLIRMALKDPNDPSIRASILIAASKHWARLFKVLSNYGIFQNGAGGLEMMGEIAQAAATQNRPGDVAAILERIADPALKDHAELRRVALAHVGNGLMLAGGSLADQIGALSKANDAFKQAIEATFEESRKIAADENKSSRARVEAMELLAYAPPETISELFDKHLAPTDPVEVQLAAVRILSARSDTDAGKQLVKHWLSFGPEALLEAAEALCRRTEWIAILLSTMEAKKIGLNLDAGYRQMLQTYSDANIRSKAVALFGEREPDRRKPIEQYREKISKMTGKPALGALVFQQTCASCHGKDLHGKRMGPDLSVMQNRSPEKLLAAILDPNRKVKFSGMNFILETTDGRTLNGIVAAESGSSVTLKHAGGGEDTILRKNIKKLSSTGISAMPEGLDVFVEPEPMAHLLRYIQDLK